MIRWMTVSEAARFFGKDASRIRRWCYSGAIIEFGFRAKRDITGHWKIGIPTGVLEESGKTSNSSQDSIAI